ncbi:transmembrane [Trichoderma arundinaceum]|uniref:Transmembrane n=1 Tax=Trichoderma arundinaceum TaxID=490622 RepID=A0A395NSE9_TRIAR|nr:transmembrane [Trichoderma arundinaceum]
MGRPLETYDDIAIAELAFYLFALGGGIFLCLKHGFTKNAGFRALIILSLARIIGACLRLATISSPSNINLYIGWMTLNGIGLAPLIMLSLGLLSRVFESIKSNGRTIIKPMYQRFIELLMILSIILLIVGGTQSTFTVIDGKPKVDYSTVSHAAAGIIVAIAALLGIAIVLAILNQSHVGAGEHRIIFTAAVCYPLILVRLTYSCLIIFGGVTTTPWLYLGMSSLMEMIVTLLSEVLGFNLDKVVPQPVPRSDEEMQAFSSK